MPAKIGFVSLGCPKALVDSERILSRLRAEGYETAADYAGAEVVVVNTCGFLETARAESLEAIGEALAENGRVIVTGCMGVEEGRIREVHPGVLAVTGPHQYEQVVTAVHDGREDRGHRQRDEDRGDRRAGARVRGVHGPACAVSASRRGRSASPPRAASCRSGPR